jgi:GWxTD domain-containing protein
MTGRPRAAGLLCGALVLLVSAAPAFSGQKAGKPKLADSHKKWLEEEAVYIIAPAEREVFLKLQTDRERGLFIEAFWKQRDPTPGSEENEFRTEHFRRISYADRYYGRDAPRPGWRTDRGRFYIILGEPREIQTFEGKTRTYDAEIWFYQGKTDLGLPAGFNLVFFRPGGRGEYELYSPVGHGPQALLSDSFGAADYASAYEQLRRIEPDLAAASLSLIPGESETYGGRPSLSSDILIQRVESAPARAVGSRYAQKFLQYKDIVEVEYTANYLDNDSLIKVFRDPSGPYFVHYAVEPRRLSVNAYEGKYYTTLKVNGRVTDPGGRLVHQFDKTVSLNLTADQMRDAGRVPFDLQDIFPLVGGDYSLSLLIKNEASKEFTSVEQALRVPPAGTGVQMTQPLLGYRAVRLEPAERRMKAFRIGPYQVYCQPGRVFARPETLVVAFQINGVAEDLAAASEVRIELLRGGQSVRAITRGPAEFADWPDVFEEIALADLPPEHYTVRTSLRRGGAEIVAAAEEFDLTFAEAVPRPWFSSRVLPGADDPVYPETIGAQLFNLGRYAEALPLLEKAFLAKPGSEETAGSLARVRLALSDPAGAAQVLAPFVGAEQAAKYETFVLAADALKRAGEPGRAVGLVDRAIARYGVNAVLLNAAGECYESLGRDADALAAFERSLALSADQPGVRKKVDALKRKKSG